MPAATPHARLPMRLDYGSGGDGTMDDTLQTFKHESQMKPQQPHLEALLLAATIGDCSKTGYRHGLTWTSSSSKGKEED